MTPTEQLESKNKQIERYREWLTGRIEILNEVLKDEPWGNQYRYYEGKRKMVSDCLTKLNDLLNTEQ